MSGQVGEQALNVGRRAARRGLAGNRLRRHHRPPVRLVHAGCVQRRSRIQAGHLDAVVAAGVENMSRVPMGSNLGPDGFAGFSEKLFERWEIVPRASRPRCSPTSGISRARRWTRTPTSRTSARSPPSTRAASSGRSCPWRSRTHTWGRCSPSTRRPGGIRRAARSSPSWPPPSSRTAWSPRAARARSATARPRCSSCPRMLLRGSSLEPRARFVSFGLAGVDPYRMLHGNPQACERALSKAGLSWDDMAVIEVNEAFAWSRCSFWRTPASRSAGAPAT